MATLNSDKIFVDPKEEISFIIERVLTSEKLRIILIIPQSSIVFSNVLSLKILNRLLVEDEKLLIIVTEDKYGANISQKAGFVVVHKVSQITSDLWEIAKSKQQQILFKLQNNKKDLVENIKKEDNIQLANEDAEDHIAEDLVLPEKIKKKDLEIVSEGIQIDKIIKEEDSKEEEVEERLDANFEEKEEFIEEIKISSANSNIRVKTINGVKILGGGDIGDLKNSKESDKMYNLDNLNMNDKLSEKRFAGKDFTRSIESSDKSSRKQFMGSLGSNKMRNPEDRFDEPVNKKKKKKLKKSVLIFGVVIILLVLILGYLVVFKWSTVTVSATLKKEDVVASENVKGDVTITEVDFANFRVPVLELKEVDSVASTAEAKGEGKKGNKSKGFVYVFNKTESTIALPKGTKLTSISSQLEYQLGQDVTLPAATRASDQSLTPSRTDDILVEASTFGENYNITGDSDSIFTIEGYEGISTLETRRDGNFEGGTTENFTSVSQENVDALKEKLLPTLKDSLKKQLSVPSGYKLVDESIQYVNEKSTPNPSVGEEAKGGTFDLSLELEVTGFIVKEDDLQSVIEFSVLQSDSDDVAKSLGDITKVEVKDFINNNGITFTVFADGTVTNQLDESEVEEAISGKNLKSAEDALGDMESLQTFEIEYYPSFIPESLRLVPTAEDRIKVKFK